MGDIVGRLFREFAVTLAVTILVSAGVSLSLTPMMCAKLLKHRKEGEKGRFYEVTEDYYNRVIAFYGRTVKWVLKHQTATLFVTFGTLVLTLVLYVVVPKGFFPVQDTGVILGISEAPDNISFDAMSQRQQELAKVILKDKDVESLSSFIGVDGTNTTPNSGRIQINLKPRDERDLDASGIIRRLQPELAKINGITLYMQPVQDLTVEDRVSRTQFQYSIEDADAQELAQWTPKLVEKLRAAPALRDVATDQLNGGLRTNLTIDRDTASRLGILPQAIDNTLYDAFGQRQVSIIFTQLNQYHVVLEVLPSFAKNSRRDERRIRSPQQRDTEFRRAHRQCSRAHHQRNSGAAFHFCADAIDQRTPGRQPPGTVPGCDAFVQPRTGRFSGRRHAGHPGSGKGNSDAGEYPRLVSRNGRRISKFAFE
jgi:multidrug efflux pump